MISHVVLVLSLLSKIVQVECHLIHTPVGENHVQRNLNLINELRSSKRFALDGGVDISKNQTLSMTDDQGVKYVCVYENKTSSASKAKPGGSPAGPTSTPNQGGIPSHDLPALRGYVLSSPRVGGHIAGAINNKSPNTIREKMAKLWETVGVLGCTIHTQDHDGDEETRAYENRQRRYGSGKKSA